MKYNTEARFNQAIKTMLEGSLIRSIEEMGDPGNHHFNNGLLMGRHASVGVITCIISEHVVEVSTNLCGIAISNK